LYHNCNSLSHQISLKTKSDWGCSSTENTIDVEETNFIYPIFENSQPYCGEANGIIRKPIRCFTCENDTITNGFSSTFVYSSVYGWDMGIWGTIQPDSIYNVSSTDTTIIEIAYQSFVDTQIQCTDSFMVILDNCNSVLDNHLQTEMNIFPNPTKDYIQIQTDKRIDNIEILSVDGKLIKKITANKNKFNISDLENGVYFVKIGNKVHKFIKE